MLDSCNCCLIVVNLDGASQIISQENSRSSLLDERQLCKKGEGAQVNDGNPINQDYNPSKPTISLGS